MKKLIPAAAWAILMLCGTVVADDLARYGTYDVVASAYSYPFDFASYPKGALADRCIEYATMDVESATKPGTAAFNQWSAVGFNDAEGGSFVFTVQSRDTCPDNMNACFDPDLLYAGGIARSGTGPTQCDVTVSWIDCGDTQVQSRAIDSYTVDTTANYRNTLYDLDSLIPDLGCNELGCVEWLQVKWHATGATSPGGTFRIGDYYDGAYYNFGVTGTCCCTPVPEPSMVAFGLTGGLGLVAVALRRRRE